MNGVAADYTLHDTDVLHTDDLSPRYILRVRDRADDDKPREKLLSLGPDSLAMAELIAVVLGVGTRKEEVMAMAQRLIREYGQVAISNERDPRRLSEALDIPIVKACQIVACLELGRRLYSSRGGQPVYIRTAQQAYSYFAPMAHLAKEQLRGLYLNSRYQLVHDEVISVGSLTANIIHPREVFEPAISHGATALIIAHNHPSGDCTPTQEDQTVTEQLAAGGRILGIEMLDHIIIGHDTYRSLIESSERP